MGWYWGATAEQVAQRLQGSNLDESIYNISGVKTATERIEEFMDQAKEAIYGKLETKTRNALNWGRFECHQVIFETQNPAQTLVDPGQEFPGIVDVDTFKIGQNNALSKTDNGISGWSIASNVLNVSESKSRGDTFYADYNVDPDTIQVPQLAAILIQWAAMLLGQEEIFGGSGDDGGISDFVESTIVPNMNQQLTALQENTSIAKLLKLRMCEPFTNPNEPKTVHTRRCSY